MTKFELIKLIAKEPQKVVFIKKDGSARTMHAKFLDSGNGGKEPAHLLTVWDIIADGWRRINVDTVKSVETSTLFTE